MDKLITKLMKFKKCGKKGHKDFHKSAIFFWAQKYNKERSTFYLLLLELETDQVREYRFLIAAILLPPSV